MSWKIVLTTFVIVFLAELGDKTQMAILLSASSTGKWLETFIGGASALVIASLIGSLAGETISKFLPPTTVKFAAGILFIVFGIFILIKAHS